MTEIVKISWYCFLVLFITSCARISTLTESDVSEEIISRADLPADHAKKSDEFWIPPSVSLDNGLSENEAAMVALANNAAFQTDLAELGLARADLIESNELPNPVFTILFPDDTNLNEFTVAQMISFLWQRPHRVQASNLRVEQVADNLTQNGLALVMNTLIAHAEYVYAKDNARLTRSLADTLNQMAEAVEAKHKAGEASELEASIIRNDALLIQDDAITAQYQADTALYRLNTLMGFNVINNNVDALSEDVTCDKAFDANALLDKAFSARPDLAAAKINISMTGEKVGLEKANIVNLTASLDATEQLNGEYNYSPRLEVEVPVFSQNQGGRARAQAELEQAMSQYVAKKHEVTLQVHDAIAQTNSACERLSYWKSAIFPQLQQQNEQIKKNYDAGEIAYLSVLTNKQKLINAERSMAAALLNQKKAIANLNFSVGQKVIGINSNE